MTSTRRVLLITFIATCALYLWLPERAFAFTPTCSSGAGHYYATEPTMGNQSSACGSPIYCRIGTTYFEWDCVLQGDGQYHPVNVVATQSFCNCGSPTNKKCC